MRNPFKSVGAVGNLKLNPFAKNLYAVFLKKNGDKYEQIGKTKFNKKDETVSFQDKTFMIPHDLSLEMENKGYVFFDWATEKILGFNRISLGYDAVVLDQFVVKKLIAQLVARLKTSLEPTDKGKILTYIIILGLGIAIGYIAGTTIK